ncbi:MAG: hypothetical protein ACOYT7_01970 [Patescibacteria group bacterium]
MQVLELMGAQPKTARTASKALHLNNLAGQILNDLKDIAPTQMNRRPHLSDIKSGTATIPIIELMDSLSPEDKNKIQNIFGNHNLTNSQELWLKKLLISCLPIQRIGELITHNYSCFLDIVRESGTTHALIQDWVDYKLGQLKAIVSTVEIGDWLLAR